MSVAQLFVPNNHTIYSQTGIIDNLDSGDQNCTMNIAQNNACRVNISKSGGAPVYINGILFTGVTGSTGAVFYGVTGPINAVDTNGIIDYGNGIIGLEYADGAHPGIVSTSEQAFAGQKNFSYVQTPFLSQVAGPFTITALGVDSPLTSIGAGALSQFTDARSGLTGALFSGAWGIGTMAATNNLNFSYVLGDGSCSNATSVSNTSILGTNCCLQSATVSNTQIIGDSCLVANSLVNNCIVIGNGIITGTGDTGPITDIILIGTQPNIGVIGSTGYIIVGQQGIHKSNTQAGIYGTNVGASGIAMYVNNNGNLGTVASDKKLKQNIKLITDSQELIAQLKPCSYQFKTSPGKTEYGLIAQHLQKTSLKDFVIKIGEDENGEDINTIQYHLFDGIILAELKRLADLTDKLMKHILLLDSNSKL